MEPVEQPRSEDLAQIAESVFSTMLGLELRGASHPAATPGVSEAMTAAVRLAGGWDGAILLRCREAQARQFAARFLDMPPPDTVDEEVRDVLGELANMIAGNVKCTLRPGIRLSCPLVAETGDEPLPYGPVICDLVFETNSGPFRITAVQADET